MKVDPFIEAEKSQVTASKDVWTVRGLQVRLLRAPKRRPLGPGAHRCRAAQADHRHPHRIQGHLWIPRIHKELGHRQMACGKRRVTRLMRAAGLEGRCKKRWRKTTVADPEAEAARDLIRRHFGPGEEMDRRYVGDITYSAQFSVMCSRRVAAEQSG